MSDTAWEFWSTELQDSESLWVVCAKYKAEDWQFVNLERTPGALLPIIHFKRKRKRRGAIDKTKGDSAGG